jgi:hypothetical protein
MKTAASRRASALLIALWAVVLMAAVVAMWTAEVGAAIDGDAKVNGALEARALAFSGLAVALHPEAAGEDALLEREIPGEGAYSVIIVSEGRRVHLNYLLVGDDPQKVAFLKRVLAARGLSLPERERLVDGLLDWVNPSTGMRRPNGRAAGPDYQPPHRPLQSLDEVEQVEGAGPLVARADWKDDFTLESAGPLDIEGVSAEMLALVPGVGAERARAFVKVREERSRRKADPQGRVYGSFEEALGDLGLSGEQAVAVSALLGFRDPVYRISSVGTARGVSRRVEALARRGGNLILWTEH